MKKFEDMFAKGVQFVGIDPDSEKSGICIIDSITGELLFESFSFFQTIEMLGEFKKKGVQSVVAVEGGFLKKAVWHTPPFINATDTRRAVGYMCKIAENVGRCNQIAILICDYCNTNGIPLEIVPLQKKNWKNGKISLEEIESIEGRKIGRCNQDERDAYVIADYVRKKNRQRLRKTIDVLRADNGLSQTIDCSLIRGITRKRNGCTLNVEGFGSVEVLNNVKEVEKMICGV